MFGQRGAEKCHGAAAQLDDCLEKVESTQEFRDLKKKEKSILKQCLQQNSG